MILSFVLPAVAFLVAVFMFFLVQGARKKRPVYLAAATVPLAVLIAGYFGLLWGITSM